MYKYKFMDQDKFKKEDQDMAKTQESSVVSSDTSNIKTKGSESTLEQAIKEIEEIKKDQKKSRTEYIQIFGVFAAIIALVGFNANASQKGIGQIIVGNLMLGFVLIGFIYLLYIVPKKIEEDKPIFNFKLPKRINVIIGVGLVLIISTWVLMDRNTNIGLCNLYPLHHLELDSITYCNK
jgi:hypothetical protein